MAKVINIVGYGSNVGKTMLMEGVIRELKRRGLSIATIKHDVHGFDIDKKGKDTYKHRQAGSETVIISSKNRFAMIEELKVEKELKDILELVKDKDIILVEGYKNSNLRKIEVYRQGISEKIISRAKDIIAITICKNTDDNAEESIRGLLSTVRHSKKDNTKNINIIDFHDYKAICDLIEKEKEFDFQNY